MANVHITAVSRADFTKTSLTARRRMAAKAVMKVFADYANHHDKSWPHVSTIALEAGCTPGVVSEATEACVKAGLLMKRKTLTGNKYVINMQLLKQLEVPRPKRRDPDFPDFGEGAPSEVEAEEPPDAPDEEAAPGQDPFSAQPKTDDDQGFSAQPKTVFGSAENRFRLSGQPFSAEPTQIPYPSPSDPPTNQSPADDGAGMAGWLGATPNGEKTETSSTEGRRLLQEWGVAGRVLDEWASVVDEAMTQLGRQEARTALTGNLGGVNSPAGVIVGKRLPALRDRLSAAASARQERGRKVSEEELNARAEREPEKPRWKASEQDEEPPADPPEQPETSAREAALAAAPKAKRPMKGTPQWKQRLDEARSASPDQFGDLLGETVGRLR